MRAIKGGEIILIAWTFTATPVAFAQTKQTGANTSKPASPVIPKKTATRQVPAPTRSQQVADVTKQVQDYGAALKKPDVASNPYLSGKTNDLLINATCNLELLKLPPVLTQDAKFKSDFLSACSDRMHGNSLQVASSTGGPSTLTARDAAIAGYTKQVQDYEAALEKPDVASNTYLSGKTNDLLIDATCNLELLKLPPGLPEDPKFADEFKAACSARLHAQPPPSVSNAGSVPVKPAGSATVKPAGSTPVPAPGTKPGGSCPSPAVNLQATKPVLNAVTPAENSTTVAGTVLDATTGKVQLCSNGKALGEALPVAAGVFSVTFDAKSNVKLTNGQEIQAQYTGDEGTSEPTEVVVGSCSLAADQGTAPDLLLAPDDKGQAKYSGTVKGVTSGAVRICINDVATDHSATIGTDGKFDGGTDTFAIKAGDKVDAQTCAGAKPCGAPFGPVSVAVPITSGPLIAGTSPPRPNGPVSILIGGVEYAGYSSEAQTTDGFLNVFYRGPVTKGFSAWTRIRLTSAAQPATNGVVSVIANPTGLTTNNFSNVGQVFDFTVGASKNISTHWALIASSGGLTPLSSQSSPVTFVAPPPGTQECTTLLDRFTPKHGYNPGLTPNTSATPTTCIANGITNLAFTNQDRSSFLLKYGAGYRTWYRLGPCKPASGTNCSPAYAAADLTLGQDSALTGGQLRGLVVKLDGILPIPTGNASWLYLFGSAYVRLQRNQNFAPLLLASPANPITVPSPTVAVLPLVQPNRDYYRIGVGLNINQLWCQVYGSSCPKAQADASASSPAPTITELDPPNTTASPANDITLQVYGTNFTKDTEVSFGDTRISTPALVNATQLTVKVSKDSLAKAGPIKVTVTNPAPGGGTASATFTVQ